MKRILSIVLVVLMLLTTVPLTGIDGLFASKAEAYSVGDYIQYGCYPQSKVTDSKVISTLNSLSKNWVSYKYYTSDTDWEEDGKMKPADYMKYCDIDLNADGINDYRAVRIDKYRPSRTNHIADTEITSYTSNQSDNGYYVGKTYYFKFEPIKWRVLDSYSGLVMTDKLLDSQAFNNYILYDGDDYLGDKSGYYYASNYYNSSIRKWLNNDFYNTAFSSTQKSNIKTSTVATEDIEIGHSQDYGCQTNDKIFLLSWDEVTTESYGFSESSSWSSSREAFGTDYAMAQGLEITWSGNSSVWRLRTPSGSRFSYIVGNDGRLYSNNWVNRTDYGIRPACRLYQIKDDISNYIEPVISVCNHTYKNVVTKATLTKDGKITSTCSLCGAKKTATAISYPKTFTVSNQAYTGKALKPSVTIKDNKGKVINAKYYTVACSNNTNMGTATAKITFKTNYSGTKSVSFKIVPAQVTGLKQTKVTTTTFTLSWSKVTGAKYYRIEWSKDGSTWKEDTTVSTNTATIKGYKAGTKYQLRVIALDSTKKFVGKASSVLKTQTLTSAPTIKLASSKSKTATVTITKVTGATKYTVYKSTDNKKWTKVGDTTKLTYNLTKLSGGKKIYVKVVAVNSYGKASAYSSVKNITVKK